MLLVITMQIILFNKPYGVHSQFRGDGITTLGDFFDDKTLRAVGRLDADSEGLLLLTRHGALNHAIAQPSAQPQAHKAKRYLVQVEGVVDERALDRLRTGVQLKDGKTMPALVQECMPPDWLWQRTPPIRARKHILTSWLSLEIFEGKNRQVRRMTAAVGLPCLRLVRTHVAGFCVQGIDVGRFVRVHLSKTRLGEFGIKA